MIVCVAGKNDIAVTILHAVLERVAADQVVIITNKTDSGEDNWQPSLKARASQLGVKEGDLESIRDIPDLVFLSMEFDRLIRPADFKTDHLFNIHFSLLPAYKGMYTSAWPLLNGEDHSGATLHYIDAGIDTGDIIDQTRFAVGPGATARDVYFTYLRTSIELVLRHLDTLLDPECLPPRRPQPAQGASYYSRKTLDYSDLRIDFRKTSWEVHNQIRAFTFREYQMPSVAGHPVCGSGMLEERSFEHPGTLVAETTGSMTLATIDYYLEIYKDLLPDVIHCCHAADRPGVAGLLPSLISLNEWDRHGETPLLAAVKGGNASIVTDLLAAGADPAVTGWHGLSPADVAQTHPDAAVRNELLSALE